MYLRRSELVSELSAHADPQYLVPKSTRLAFDVLVLITIAVHSRIRIVGNQLGHSPSSGNSKDCTLGPSPGFRRVHLASAGGNNLSRCTLCSYRWLLWSMSVGSEGGKWRIARVSEWHLWLLTRTERLATSGGQAIWDDSINSTPLTPAYVPPRVE